jgi:phosphoribosylformimino-5-aminoimidazole carboxamide ribotide isomerase
MQYAPISTEDGMLQGPSVELYRTILETTDINLIASGGVTTMKDIEDLRSCRL